MKFQDWQSCIMLNFGVWGWFWLLLVIFYPFVIMKASEHHKTAQKSYYCISFDYLVPIHSHLGSCRPNRDAMGLILWFWRFGPILATFGYFWHIFHPGDLQTPKNYYKNHTDISVSIIFIHSCSRRQVVSHGGLNRRIFTNFFVPVANAFGALIGRWISNIFHYQE